MPYFRSYISFIWLFFSALSIKSQHLSFDKISKKENLPDNHVFAITQDKYGYMWFGTSNGLVRYDGYSFTTWKNIPNDTTSIPHNEINVLHTSETGELYVGTVSEGFCEFDYGTQTFKRYGNISVLSGKLLLNILSADNGKLWICTSQGLFQFDTQAKKTIPKNIPGLKKGDFVSSVVKDKLGTFWMYTQGNRVLRYFPKTNTSRFLSYSSNQGNNFLTHGGRLLLGNNGTLWIGTEMEGLYKLNTLTGKVENYSVKNGILSSNIVLSLHKDKLGNIWVGTDGGGLYRFPAKNTYLPEKFETNPENPGALSSNTVYSIYEIAPNIIWFGTFGGGISINNPSKQKFHTLSTIGTEGHKLRHQSVLSVSPASDGAIWIGTDGGGLHLFHPTKNTYEYFNVQNKKLHHSDVSKSVFTDSKGRIWVGSYAGGVAVFDKDMNPLRLFSVESKRPIGSNHVWNIVEDKQGYIWVAHLVGGVTRISPELEVFQQFRHENVAANGMLSESVYSLALDKDGKLWAATDSKGLLYYDPHKNRFFPYTPKGYHLPENLMDIAVDQAGNLWVASNNEGFYKIPYSDESRPILYNQAHGLTGNTVYSLVSDHSQNIWLTTDVGISCLVLNKGKEHFLNFDPEDGTQSGQFNYGSRYCDKEGFVYLGGSEGYHRFHPKNITFNHYIPKVAITDIKVFNKSITKLDKYEKFHIGYSNDTSRYTFDYQDNVLSFHFTSFDYVMPSKNSYKYKLEGFDQQWHMAPAHTRSATYTNLDPGTYIFKIKASNNDGVWNEKGSQIKVIILPPWWMTIWFRILMGIFVLFMIGFFIKWRTRAIRKRNLELKKQVAAQTHTLSSLNEELKDQNEKITCIYQELTDSIAAAKVIQNAILPSQALLEEHFEKIEVLYIPKDVVSGDFYWLANDQNRSIIATVDCTGHGVAGAFMTLLGYNTLNHIIRERPGCSAGTILTLLNQEILDTLNRYENGEANAGMDISLCIFEKGAPFIQFAGANTSLYIHRGGEILIKRADRRWIGGRKYSENFKFSTQYVEVLPNDKIILFTDGYAGQIGGPTRNQKYMFPRFRETLVDCFAMEDCSIKEQLTSDFQEWKGEEEQMDDVLVVVITCPA